MPVTKRNVMKKKKLLNKEVNNLADIKGYSLFDDVQDRRLRIRNQAIVLANIFEDNMLGMSINKRGTELTLAYFQSVKDEDKQAVYTRYAEVMGERGFKETL